MTGTELSILDFRCPACDAAPGTHCSCFARCEPLAEALADLPVADLMAYVRREVAAARLFLRGLRRPTTGGSS